MYMYRICTCLKFVYTPLVWFYLSCLKTLHHNKPKQTQSLPNMLVYRFKYTLFTGTNLPHGGKHHCTIGFLTFFWAQQRLTHSFAFQLLVTTAAERGLYPHVFFWNCLTRIMDMSQLISMIRQDCKDDILLWVYSLPLAARSSNRTAAQYDPWLQHDNPVGCIFQPTWREGSIALQSHVWKLSCARWWRILG